MFRVERILVIVASSSSYINVSDVTRSPQVYVVFYPTTIRQKKKEKEKKSWGGGGGGLLLIFVDVSQNHSSIAASETRSRN